MPVRTLRYPNKLADLYRDENSIINSSINREHFMSREMEEFTPNPATWWDCGIKIA